MMFHYSFYLCSTQQHVALTTENPEKRTIFSTLYNMYSQSKKKYWLQQARTVCHSNQENIVSINLEDLHVGQSVGLLVSQDGELHLFVDGKHREMVWSGLPTDQPLWGAADLFGRCAKIKADILYGKR